MTRRELASWLCARVHADRLAAAGELADDGGVPFEQLPGEMQQPWLETADAVLELLGEADVIARLQSLGADWMRYTTQIGDPAWRDEMRRTVVIEMLAVIAGLGSQCGLTIRRDVTSP